MLSSVPLYIAATMALFGPLAPQDTVRARVTATIGENSPTTPFLIGEISGIAIDDAGRTYVSDMKEPRLLIFGPTGKHLATIGRKGQGPGEFTAPTGPVLGPDGALYVRDMEKVHRFARVAATGLATQFDRFFEGPPMAPWMSKLPSAIDRQGRFHFPREVGMQDGLTHNSYWRYTLDGKRADTIGVPLQPTTRSAWASVMVSPGTGRIVKGVNVVPFHPMPVWTVSPAGTVISGPADRYEFTETDPLGKVLRRIARDVAPTKIPAAERAESLKALKRRIDSLAVPLAQVRGASDEVKALKLPENYPFYRSVFAAPDGALWVRRWSPPAQQRVSLFDVFTPAGAYHHTVTLPANCAGVPAPVVRGRTLACVSIDDETDTESLVIATLGG